MMNTFAADMSGPTKNRISARRGSTLLMTLVYMLMFGALASSMVAFSQGNMQVEQAATDSDQALIAAESGMSFLLLQMKTVGMPIINEGDISFMTAANRTLLWSGTRIENGTVTGLAPNANNNGIAVQVAAAINASGAVTAGAVTTPTGTNALTTPNILVDPTASSATAATYNLSMTWDPTLYTVTSGSATYMKIVCKSTGTSHSISRSVSTEIWLQKTFKYAVYSNVAIQLGKNVRVKGDIASAYTGTNKGPPIQMFSDWHYIANTPGIDNDLATLRSLLNTYDSLHDNRLSVADTTSSAAIAAKNAGLSDLNGDGYIDDFDIALKNFDKHLSTTSPTTNGITTADFTNPNTGTSYDQDLFSVIDDPLGAVNAVTGLLVDGTTPPTGYNDGTLNYYDNYAKIEGTVSTALTYQQWVTAAGTSGSSGWSAWGDTSGGASGTRFVDMFEGPVMPTDPNAAAVQFGPTTVSQSMTPQNFDTSSYKAMTNYQSAATATTDSNGNKVFSNGYIGASNATGTPVTEQSGDQEAWYTRPVFTNVTFNNVYIKVGTNAKFVNCTFKGVTFVGLTTNITSGGTVSHGVYSGGTTTNDPSAGQTWAQTMLSGTFSATTPLLSGTIPGTQANSVAAQQGNNLHFSSCTFDGGLSADVPTAYTHFANSWDFDGTTTFNNQSTDQSYTILAPNTNIEVGSYVAPSANPSTLVGAVVAGNIDIRGTANVDGSLVVPGNGATNTTLGYFGTTDSGQAIPNLSQLPSEANGSYGHLFVQNNSTRPIPNGIKIPLIATAQTSTYQIN